MAENLGALFYTLNIRDLTDADLQRINKKLNKLGLEIDTKKFLNSLEKALESYKGKDLALKVDKQILHDSIRDSLKSQPFPISVRVEAASAQQAVRDALQHAGLQRGFTAADKRQHEAETKRMAAMQVAAAKAALAESKAAAANALAQQRLASAHRTVRRATDSHIHSSISLGSAMRGNIRIAGELGPMLASAYSVVALKNFMTKVVEIGGELEKQKLAMKAILGDEGMANTISSQINSLAVKSPFGVLELNQYAKQLTAFQIPYNELFDTMKRLADISAATGTDMGRIILAFGQIRSATVLKGTEARQLTEANIPIFKMLSDYYSELEARTVSVGEVMDRMSKKKIPFEDVKNVLWELTNEGGRFYNMQEELSESLQAKWKNLGDALDLMYADIAKSTSGPLKGLAELLTKLTTHWATVATAIKGATIAFVLYKVAIRLCNRHIADSTVLLKLNSAAIGANLNRWQLLGVRINKAAASIRRFITSARGMVSIATLGVGAAIEAAMLLWQRHSEQMSKAEEAGKELFTKATEGAKNLSKTIEGIKPAKGLSDSELTQGIEEMVTAIKDYSATPIQDINDALATQDGLLRPIQDRYEALRKKLIEIKAEFDKIADLDISGMIEVAEKGTNGTLIDGVRGNIADYDDAVVDYKRNLANTATSKPKAVHQAIKEIEAISQAFREATKNMTSDAQKFAELANNRKKYGISKENTPTAAELLGDLGIREVNEQRAKMVKDLNIFWRGLEKQAATQGISKLSEASESNKRAFASQLKDWVDAHAISSSTKKELLEYVSSKLDFKYDADDMSVIGSSAGNNGTPADTGDGGDSFADSLRQRFKDIKDAWSEFQKWSKTEGRDAAAKRIGDSGIFSTLSADEIPQTVEQYRALVKQIEDELRKAGVKGTKRESLLNELLKQLLDIDKTVVDEQLSVALDKISKEAERQLADWKLFDKIHKATGNQNLAMGIAFGMNPNAETDYVQLMKNKFNAIAKASGSKFTYGTATPELLQKEGIQEVQKAYEQAYGEINKYHQKEREDVADILAKYQSLQDKLGKIDYDRDEEIRKVNASDLTPGQKVQAIQRINTEADYKKFTQSNEYLQFFAGIYALTNQEATRIGDLIEQNLNKRLQAGTISAEDYYKEIERIRQQLDKLRNVKSDAMTFMTGGVNGLNDKRMETNDAARLESIQKIQKIEKELAEAKAEVKGIDDAEGQGKVMQLQNQLNLAKQELYVQNKIRDKLIKNKETWQSVLDVANIASGIASVMSDAFNSIKDMASAFGADTDSGAWADIGAVMDTLTAVTGGVQKVVQSAMSGDIGGILGGVVSTITTPFTIWATLHDKKLQKMIERSKEAAQIMQNQYDILEKQMAYFLGNAANMNVEGYDGKGGAYGKQLELMKGQLAELEKQRQAEIDKKKTDNSVVEDYNKQIEEMKISIRAFAGEVAKDIYGIDLKGWAKQLGDALFEAWKRGENGAEAFKKKASEIVGAVLNNIFRLKVLEPMMEQLAKDLFGEDGQGGIFGKDFELTSNEVLDYVVDNLMEIGDAAKQYSEFMDEANRRYKEKTGQSLKDDESKSGLSAGIQSITEGTADLLASYVNSIRAYVAEIVAGRIAVSEDIRLIAQDVLPRLNTIAESQLRVQEQIAANTLANAKAAQDIYNLLNRNIIGANKFHI